MSLFETIQDFPAGVPISACNITPRNTEGVVTINTAGSGSASRVFPGQRWELELEFLPMDREEAAILEAFLMSLRGSAGAFRFGDPFQSLPRGKAAGTPMTVGAAAGAETLDLSGLFTNIPLQLAANDRIQIGDHLYAVLSDAASDENGDVNLTLWPPLRESYIDGTPVVCRNARGVFALTEIPQFTRSDLEIYGARITAYEVKL